MIRTKKKNLKKLPEYTTRGCPLTKNESKWCFGMCPTDGEGKGACGRIAPHKLKGRIQEAIDAYKAEHSDAGA